MEEANKASQRCLSHFGEPFYAKARPLPNSSRKGVIMGGNHWQHTALDHQNYDELRRNDVLSRWREVRHCS
jgi:hypothetical protein